MKYSSEADVESKYVYDILLKDILKVSKDNIRFHVPVQFNQGHEVKNKEADVLVKDENGNNFFVIDSKAPNQNLEKYFGQIDSYAFALETRLSILTNANRLIVRMYESGNKKIVILDSLVKDLEKENYQSLLSIFANISLQENDKLFCDAKKTNEIVSDRVINYRRTFRNIHNKIRSIDKLDPSSSFDEFSKVLFIKIINDKLKETERLTVETIEKIGNRKLQKKYIDDWFYENTSKYYSGIFMENEKIFLSPNALMKIISMLDNEFDLNDSLTDIKGRAFEEFLPSQLRGKGLGQFFTPRTVVDFMVYLADISFKDTVLDFASGSGGFLIKAFSEKKKIIKELPKTVLDALGKTRVELEEDAKKQIFGIDVEPRAVRTAKMNMLLWGDGKQIQYGNGLSLLDNYGNEYMVTEYDSNKLNSGVDVILANPPFGAKEEDQEILSRYTLPNVKNKNGSVEYSNEKTENLFVERAWKLLKPDGKLLIVLPEGIFSNSNSKTRDFILSHFRVDTIIKLPKHTFVMSGVDTINTVILFAYKNNECRQKEIILSDKATWISKNNPMTINFASVNQVGFEPSGKIIGDGYSGSDFKILLDKISKFDFEKIISDPIEYAELEYGDNEKSQSWKKSLIKFIRRQFTDVPSRIDPTYYFFNEESASILNEFIDIPLDEGDLVRNKYTNEELEENPEKIYQYVSVTKNRAGKIVNIEEKTVDELVSVKSKPQKLEYNDVVFNPYRINTGSIIRINSHDDNLITSDAYITIRSDRINSEYLVQLLKTPFMKYQIQVLASGSVRDNFGVSSLLSLKIPNVAREEQENIVEKANNAINEITKIENNIAKKENEIVDMFMDFES